MMAVFYFLRPTARGWVVLCLGVGAFLVMLVNPGFIMAAFTSVIWAVLAVSFVMALFSLHLVDFKREPGQDGHRGQVVSLPVRVTNRSRHTRQAMVLLERCPFAEGGVASHVVPPLAGKESRRIRRPVMALDRGEFELRTIRLRGGDPAGLFAREKRLHQPQNLLIMPETVTVSHLPMQLRHRSRTSSTGNPIGTSGIGQDFYGIREYQPTDGIRFIDWKATARQQKPMVREFEENTIHQVSIFLDTHQRHVNTRDDATNNFEYLLTMGASLVEYLSGIHCELLFSCGRRLDERQIAGPAQTVRPEIMRLLTVVEPDSVSIVEQLEDGLEFIGPDSIVYCLTMHEPDALESAFEVLMSEGVVVRWIHAPKNMFDPIADVYKTRAVQRFMEQRQRLVNPVIVNSETGIPGVLAQSR